VNSLEVVKLQIELNDLLACRSALDAMSPARLLARSMTGASLSRRSRGPALGIHEVEASLRAMKTKAVALGDNGWGCDKDYVDSLGRHIAALLDVATVLVRIGTPRRPLKERWSDLRSLRRLRLAVAASRHDLDRRWEPYLHAMFDGLLNQNGDPLARRADELMQSAQMNAISMFAPLVERFPLLREAQSTRWDLVVVVAGVFMAVMGLTELKVGRTRKQTLLNAVEGLLGKLDGGNGLRLFHDCSAFFLRYSKMLAKTGQPSRLARSDAVGFWMVWNLLERWPEADHELALVRQAGMMLAEAFSDYWSEQRDGAAKV
jgi:hypothetical protein